MPVVRAGLLRVPPPSRTGSASVRYSPPSRPRPLLSLPQLFTPPPLSPSLVLFREVHGSKDLLSPTDTLACCSSIACAGPSCCSLTLPPFLPPSLPPSLPSSFQCTAPRTCSPPPTRSPAAVAWRVGSLKGATAASRQEPGPSSPAKESCREGFSRKSGRGRAAYLTPS